MGETNPPPFYFPPNSVWGKNCSPPSLLIFLKKKVKRRRENSREGRERGFGDWPLPCIATLMEGPNLVVAPPSYFFWFSLTDPEVACFFLLPPSKSYIYIIYVICNIYVRFFLPIPPPFLLSPKLCLGEKPTPLSPPPLPPLSFNI